MRGLNLQTSNQEPTINGKLQMVRKNLNFTQENRTAIVVRVQTG